MVGSESSIESSLHQMRSRIRSVFISSRAADQAAMSVNQWKSAPMKKPSFRHLAAQLALCVGARLCLMLALAQSHGSNAAEIYLLVDVTPVMSAFKTQFGKVDSTTGVFTQIAANVSNGLRIGNPTWNPTANAFYVTSEPSTSITTLNMLDTSGTLSGSIGTLAADMVFGMAYNTADSSLYAYSKRTVTWPTTVWNYSNIDPATGASTVLTTPLASLGTLQTGNFAIHQGTLYSSQTRVGGAGQFGSFGFTAGSNYQQIGSNNSNFAYMSLASDGSTLFGVKKAGSSFKLFTINPATGALDAGIDITGMSGGDISLLGVGAISVPEPGTNMLALIGAALLAAKARLRRRRAQLA
jgi:hypothetical protein